MDTNPVNECVLVELISQHGGVTTTEKKFDSDTSGLILAVAPGVPTEIVGKVGRWRMYKDDNRWRENSKNYALIEYKDVMGVSK